MIDVQRLTKRFKKLVAVDTVSSGHVDANAYMARTKSGGAHPLDHWIVFEVLGVILGGMVAAYSAGRLRIGVLRGPRISVPARLAFAFSGGIIMGMAARLARGCTSGQALSGGALLSAGSWGFMLCIFAGGYALAYFMRKEWL